VRKEQAVKARNNHMYGTHTHTHTYTHPVPHYQYQQSSVRKRPARISAKARPSLSPGTKTVRSSCLPVHIYKTVSTGQLCVSNGGMVETYQRSISIYLGKGETKSSRQRNEGT